MRKKIKLSIFAALATIFCALSISSATAQCPAISSISPSSGPANTVVTITGSNFEAGSGVTTVFFNGIAAAGFTVVSDTELKAIVPATGTTGAISVTANACPATSGVFTRLDSDCSPASVPTELYISELYDHTPGSYGVIELYNPTNATITFGGQYVLERYGDIGGSLSYTLNLPGSVGPHETYLVLSSQNGDAGCTVATDANMGSGINGNDEFKLWKNGTLIDIARAPSNAGYTVIRTPDADAPSNVYAGGDWTFSGQNCSNLGIHSSNIAVPATITTQPVSASTCEGGQAQFSVAISDPAGFSFQWKMLNGSGNWVNVTNGANYSGTTTATLTVDPALLAFNGNQYYCQITSGSCTLLTNAVQLTVSPLPVVLVNITQPDCITATGSLSITPAVGEGLTYKINNGPFQSATTFTGLAPGDYILTIQSASNCTSTMDITIDPVPAAPAVATVTTVQPTCASPSGSITVTAPLGPGITYSIDGSVFQTGTTFGGLMPGPYTIIVKNAAGCTSETGTVVINAAPDAPAVATVSIIQPDCTTATGSIAVTAPIGAGITYSIDGATFQPGTAFSGLVPGNYTITVKNADGCTSVTGNIAINPAPSTPAVAAVTTIQPDCAVSTGTITVTAPVGAGLTYSIDGSAFQGGTSFTGLVPGSYKIIVKNAAGCTSETGTIVINAAPDAPAVPTVSIIQPDCTTPAGTITITAPMEAGMAYSIDGTTFQANHVFSGLIPGNYTITVKNADGCTSITNNIVINPVPNAPAPATVAVMQPTCAAPQGSITVTSPAGGGFTYSLDGISFQTDTVFSGLASGSYTVTVKNAEGCTSVTGTITIDPAPVAPATPTVSIQQPGCTEPTGTITVAAPTGAGLTYSIDGLTFQSETTFSGLTPGDYTITVKNTDGCTSVSGTLTVNAVPEGPQISGTQGCRDSAFGTGYILEGLPLAESFDIATATFEWRNDAGSIVGNDDNTFNISQYVDDNGLTAQDFPIEILLTVTIPNGCSNIYTFTVEGAFCTIPRGISPNNDFYNDNFDITGLNAKKLTIYNRYGQEVYSRVNYTNEWSGQTDNGDELPSGTYFYVIETPSDAYTGWVYINR